MYYSGTLSIDPAELTHIEIVPPTKAFAKFLHCVTGGLASEREERETFTAVAILQQLNVVLRSMGITNLVRLAKDDFDFYFDHDGKRDDLKEVFQSFNVETDSIESEIFETLYLVVEHEDDLLKYLVEIEIKRRHKPGEAPVEVKVNGVMKGLEPTCGESADDVGRRMESIFESQGAYNAHTRLRQTRFDAFLHDLEQNMKKFVKVDHIAVNSNAKIIRPQKPIEKPSEIRYSHRRPRDRTLRGDASTRKPAEPVYYGYYGFTDSMYYAWIWSSMAHSHSVHVSNCDLVDESGHALMSVGAEGIDAGDSDLFNPDQPFETASAETDSGDFGDSTGGDSSGGWFGSLFDSSSDGGSSFDGSSSCGGGCGSCGGV